VYSLKTLQDDVLNGLINSIEDKILLYIKPSSIAAKDRLQIYRNSVLGNLCNSLHLTFPGIWKLIGQECANAVARSFISKIHNLPSSGCLDDWGFKFPGFLQDYPTLRNISYLRDYAELEWYSHLSYCASNVGYLSLTALAQIEESQISRFKFSFHPSVFLFRSIFPLEQIHQVVKDDNAPEITLKEEPTYAVIARDSDYCTNIFWVSEAYFTFLSLLKEGKKLEEVVSIMDFNVESELAQILSFMLSKQLINKII
jgi:hypothetical protein